MARLHAVAGFDNDHVDSDLTFLSIVSANDRRSEGGEEIDHRLVERVSSQLALYPAPLPEYLES